MRDTGEIPAWMKRFAVIGCFVALIPPLLAVRARVTKSDSPRIHLVPDMDNQKKFKAQAANPLFADGRAMRPQVDGTVARGQLVANTHLTTGFVDGTYATTFPMPVTRALLDRGRTQYGVYCAVCHGESGYGDGAVSRRADQLMLAGKALWVPPTSYHTGDPLTREVGHLFNTITNGIRTMPAYSDQISAEDRWAIVAYVKALQRSQGATIDDVPEAERRQLEQRRASDRKAQENQK